MHANKQSGFTVMDTVLIGAMCAAIVAVGYIAYQNYQASPSAPAIPFLPAATKSYTDPAGIFSLKYPANWKVSTQPSAIGSGYWLQVAENSEVDLSPVKSQHPVVTINVFNANPDLAAFEKLSRGAATNGQTFTDLTVNSQPAFIERQSLNGDDVEYFAIGKGSHIVDLMIPLKAGQPDPLDNTKYLHQFANIAHSVKILK